MRTLPPSSSSRRSWRAAVLAALLTVSSAGLIAGCASRGVGNVVLPDVAMSQAATPVYPGTSWERVASPAAAGWSQAGIDSVRARLSTLPTTGFVAIVGGRIVMDYGDLAALSYLASVRKSILSMLYGIAAARGEVNLDRTLAQIGIDDVAGLTDTEKQATTRDLLGARSGIYHDASNGGDDRASAPPRGSQLHGTFQLYNNWDFNALGTIYEKETGRNIYDDVETRLARPLGFEDWDRTRQQKSGDSTKSRHLAYHMFLSTRDMARIGYLMLRDGRWRDTQVVPQAWVRESTRPVTPVTAMNPVRRRTEAFGYGYLWWVWDGPKAVGPYEGAYIGLGAVGQQIAVLPKLDLVVVHKTAPRQGQRGVSHDQFLEVLDMLVRTRCPDGRCGAAGGH